MSLTPKPASACSWYDICPGDVTFDAFNTAIDKLSDALNAVINFAKKSAYTTIISLFSSVTSVFNNMMESLFGTDSEGSMAEILISRIQSEEDVKKVDKQISAHANDTLVAATSIATAKAGITAGGADQFLCNVIKTRQALDAIDQFVEMGTRILADGVDAVYMLGGTGSRHWATSMLQMCGQLENDTVPTGNEMDLVPQVCRAPQMLSDRAIADLDASANALARNQAFTMPAIKQIERTVGDVTMTFSVLAPDAEDDKIKESMERWMVAKRFCEIAGGYRPPPPRFNAGATPMGRLKYNRMKTCRDRQKAFTTVCMRRLMTLTHPDCTDDAMKAFCVSSTEACLAARDGELELGPEYVDCQNGLNKYQLENISVHLCGATRRVLSDTLDGASQGDRQQTMSGCEDVVEEWEQKVADADKEFNQALESLQDIQKCFEDADKIDGK